MKYSPTTVSTNFCKAIRNDKIILLMYHNPSFVDLIKSTSVVNVKINNDEVKFVTTTTGV